MDIPEEESNSTEIQNNPVIFAKLMFTASTQDFFIKVILFIFCCF